MRRATAYHREWLEACARLPGAERAEHGGAVAVHSGVAWPLFNGGIGGSADEAARAVSGLRDAGRPFFWWVTAEAAPGTEAVLAAAGLAPFVRDEPWQEADRGALPGLAVPRGLSIDPVRDEAAHRAWAATVGAVYGLPPAGEAGWVSAARRAGWSALPWSQWLGCMDGAPTGTTMLFEGAGVAGLWAVGVVRERRRAGIGRALTLAPLATAQAPVAGFSATPAGSRLYETLGFRAVDAITRWLWMPPGFGDADADLDAVRRAGN